MELFLFLIIFVVLLIHQYEIIKLNNKKDERNKKDII